MSVTSFFTIDVEEYYHICGTKSAPPLSEWDKLPVTVEKNLLKLLDVFNNYNVKTTCFFLGYIAKKHPHLVKETLRQGHEIASHGMYHDVVYNMTEQQFGNDIADAKHLLEDITGKEIIGYRSPSFSATGKTPWFFEALIKAGYKYDSSVFPANRSDGGMKSDMSKPAFINTANGKIFEFPISTTPILGKNFCFFGGGYLRLFPVNVILNRAAKLKENDIPVLYYIHPREIDPHHPRLKMSIIKNFKTYVNLNSVQTKLDKIISSSDFVTLEQYYNKTVKDESPPNEKQNI